MGQTTPTITTTPRDSVFARPLGKFAAVAGVLTGPIAWSIQLQLNYALARFMCGYPWLKAVFHGSAAALLLLSLAAGVLSWREWRAGGGGAPSGTEPGVFGRTRFLAALGMASSALFSLVIVAQWIPIFFIDPCDY